MPIPNATILLTAAGTLAGSAAGYIRSKRAGDDGNTLRDVGIGAAGGAATGLVLGVGAQLGINRLVRSAAQSRGDYFANLAGYNATVDAVRHRIEQVEPYSGWDIVPLQSEAAKQAFQNFMAGVRSPVDRVLNWLSSGTHKL